MSALEDLYRRFAPLVHAKARRIVGEAEADDVVQEVFLRLMRRSPESEAAMVQWLCATTTHLALDRLRFCARRGAGWEGAVRDHVEQGRPADLESALALRESCGKLLTELDRESQEVAVLVHLEQMNHDEAAQTLKVTRRTIGNRLRRLEERARRILARWAT